MFARCAVSVALLLLLATSSLQAASIDTSANQVDASTVRVASGEQLVEAVINDCLAAAGTTACLKGRVLSYLDTQLGASEGASAYAGRSFESDNKLDEVLVDRAARVLQQQSFSVRLPEPVFGGAVLSYTPEAGLDVVEPVVTEARGHLLKKKVLLPILLLLKLKMKALMPIVVGLVGLKAFKALILSKLAITLVLGFVIYQLIAKKTAAMPMMPMTESPAAASAYGPPTTSSQSSYVDTAAWDTSSSGGPYARVWEPSTSASGQSLAYSSYYPSSGSASSGSGSASSSSGSSSVVSSLSSGSGSSSY